MKSWGEMYKMSKEDREEYLALPEIVAELAEMERKSKEEREKQERMEMEYFAGTQPGLAKNYVVGIGIPRRASGTVFEETQNVEQTEAIKAIENALDLLVLSGSPGCGKTIAAAMWVWQYVREPKRWKQSQYDHQISFTGSKPIWITAARLSRWDRYDEDAMKELLTTKRLVVDDLGGEYLDKNGFYTGLLDELVNEREANKCPTIFTTNLNAQAFRDRYGERIYDRIKEGGRFVACGNVSMRKAG
jgi:DNA replication protein DnaC